VFGVFRIAYVPAVIWKARFCASMISTLYNALRASDTVLLVTLRSLIVGDPRDADLSGMLEKSRFCAIMRRIVTSRDSRD